MFFLVGGALMSGSKFSSQDVSGVWVAFFRCSVAFFFFFLVGGEALLLRDSALDRISSSVILAKMLNGL